MAEKKEKITNSECTCKSCSTNDVDVGDGIVSVPDLYKAIKDAGEFVYDLETSCLSYREGYIEGVAFYVPPVKDNKKRVHAWYPFTENTYVKHIDGVATSLRPAMNREEVMRQLKPVFEDPTILKISANGKFDDEWLMFTSGLDCPINVAPPKGDSMLVDYLSDERRHRYGLKVRVFEVFGHQMTTYEEASQRQGMFSFMNPKPLGAYAQEDAYWTYTLHQDRLMDIRKQDPSGKLEKIYWNIEMPLRDIIVEMETTGCLLDYDHLVEVSQRLNKQKAEIFQKIITSVGWAPNLRSPKQVSDFLYNSEEDGGLGLPTDGLEQGVSGEYSTAEKIIKHFGRKNELVNSLLEYRSLDVIDRSFAQKLAKIAQEEGRVHSNFSQTGTVISRLACVAEDTLINTNMGLIEISKLPESGKYKVATHTGTFKPILNKIFKGKDEMYEVSLDNESSIKCTKDHKFLTPNGWQRLGDLTITSTLISYINSFSVSNIKDIAYLGIQDVWDIEVEEDASYLAQGFINHNSSKPVNLMNQPREKNMIRKAFVARLKDDKSNDLHLINGDYCITLDARVPTSNGYIKMSDIKEGDLVNYYFSKTGTINKVIPKGMQPINIISTEDGYSLKATPLHRIRILRNNEYSWCRVGEIRTTDKIALQKGQQFYPESTKNIDISYSGTISEDIWRGSLTQIRYFISDAINTTNLSYRYGEQQIVIIENDLDHIRDMQRLLLYIGHTSKIHPPRSLIYNTTWCLSIKYDQVNDFKKDFGVFNILLSHEKSAFKSIDPIFDETGRNISFDLSEANIIFQNVASNYYKGEEIVADLSVPGDMTYISGGFVSHNSQVELRIAASLSNESNMLEVYQTGSICVKNCDRYALGYECNEKGCKWEGLIQKGILICGKCGSSKISHQARCRHTDLHQRTSEDVGVPRNPIAKGANFSLLYRVGAPKFVASSDLYDKDGNPMEDYARDIIAKWHKAYPGISYWHQVVEEELKRDKWIAYNLLGRQRRLDQERKFNDFKAVTQAIQFRVSSLAQECIKLGMIKVYKERQRLVANSPPATRKMWERLKFLIQVHDELMWECPGPIVDDAKALIKPMMEGVAKLKAPLVFAIKSADGSWEDCH